VKALIGRCNELHIKRFALIPVRALAKISVWYLRSRVIKCAPW